ncbi:hypothetical protein BGZ70_000579 [Mortierella alpina]|uniref:Uncharacterized protein n=1 Tax=Mortierella alpina TaxID=64518 RepID=A0A9P6IXK8_MORAP|nr:hypothetical protein BGZ70_000579 [Mortierella alpina]
MEHAILQLMPGRRLVVFFVVYPPLVRRAPQTSKLGQLRNPRILTYTITALCLYNKTIVNMASKQNKNQQQQQTTGKAAHPAQHSSEQTSNHGKNAAHGANAQSTHKAGADKQQQNSGASANNRADANKQHHNQNKKSSGSHPQKVDGHH